MSTTFTINDLIREVRINTLYTNPDQVSDQQILYYFNIFNNQDSSQYAQFVHQKSIYYFVTQNGIDKYPFPINQYLGITGKIYIQNVLCRVYQDPNIFGQVWQQNNQSQLIGNGNGGTTYALRIPFPMIRGYTNQFGHYLPGVVISTSLTLGGTQLNLTDDGFGNFIGDGSGTVDYFNGLINITFNQPTSFPIYCNNITYQSGQPNVALYYDSTITLRNVPNQPYFVQMEAYINPATFSDFNAPIILNNSFKFFVYGTARYLLTQTKDMAQLQIIDAKFQEQMNMLLRITERYISNVRIPTLYNTGLLSTTWQTNIPYGTPQ